MQTPSKLRDDPEVQHIALQRCLDLRASFVASVFTFAKEMLVWVDESGSNLKDMLRKYGYALHGELYVLGYQWISSIPAMSTERILAVELTRICIWGKTFDFVCGS